MRRERIALVLTALVVLVPTIARADDEIDPSTLRAEKLAEEAASKSEAGAHLEAIELLLEAYKSAPAAILLFDVARIYDRKLEYRAQAIDYYRRALDGPDLEEQLAADARVRILALEGKDNKPKTGLTIERPLPNEERMHPLAIAGLVTAGAGVLSLGVSGVLALVASGKDDDANAFCDGDRCTDPRAIELTRDATSLANAATVTFVVGAVLAAGGVVLWLVAPTRTSPRAHAGVRF